jgi:acid phosphatase
MEQHDNLNAVLWVQTAAEYSALTQQAYTTAQLALDDALLDPSWTASVEQAELANYTDLPPAVILDVDETVLDNSPFQARLIRDGQTYSSEAWASWTSEQAALAIPGALAYTKEASERGITVFYVTNRRATEEVATRNNLRELGFPLAERVDVILTRGEKPEWDTSDKTPRREYLAQRYRILQLVGDNLGDFIEVNGSLPERMQAANLYPGYWGMRWIVLPNPTYGNWEGALFDNDRNLSPAMQRQRKLKQLRY